MLQEVREALLEEASHSPNLLADLAGLEDYVAEAYNARSFVELLQNADDATAKRFMIVRSGDLLYVANDGRLFSKDDFETLCRSAASHKIRGQSIGYRGIGFKSVVSFARRVHLFSGTLAATFSRERTQSEIPQATRVPLVRIPHFFDEDDVQACVTVVQSLQRDAFGTVFVFSGLLAHAIETEFASFDQTSLLFLRSVQEITLQGADTRVARLTRETVYPGESRVTLKVNEETSHWVVLDRAPISIAFATESNRIIRLPDEHAVVHAFLPTKEKSGISAKINGDVSTDPSRTRIVLDDRTAECVLRIADIILELVQAGLEGRTRHPARSLLQAIVPGTDLRMATFQKPSFERSLMQTLLDRGRDQFSNWRLRPSWFRNCADFEKIASASNLKYLPPDLESIDGLVVFLKALGATEASLKDLDSGLSNYEVSTSGAADVIERLSILNSTHQLDVGSIGKHWKIWPVNGRTMALPQALASSRPLDNGCLDIVRERLGVLSDTRRLVEEISDPKSANALVPADIPRERDVHIAMEPTGTTQRNGVAIKGNAVQLKKWRTAEQYVFDFLTSQEWEVKDVSRQNLGYDLDARAPSGENYCVEIKSINNIGESFTLTSNEAAVAGDKREEYLLALVHASSNVLRIAFIANPINKLALVKQCRQWAWVCDEYPFDAESISLA